MEFTTHPFFQRLSPKDGSLLAKDVRVYQASAETIIFDENTPSDGLYLLLSGTIAISKRQADGSHRLVNYVKSGSCLGEIGILLDTPRTARATALSDITYAVLPSSVLRPLFDSMPSVLKAIVSIVADHLNNTTHNYMRDIVQQENLAMLGTLVNSVLHDFKNPLTLVALNSQLLSQLHQDERTRTLCRNIEAQVERMSAMASEIGEFSRSGERTLFSRVNLRDLAETFHFLNAPLFESDQIDIEIDVEPVELEAEPRKLLRVLQNIVSNAIEALGSTGDAKITIQGFKSPDSQSVILRISDNGPGIPPAAQKRFWEPFFTQGKATGTGLGSSIAKALVESHGGTIQFESSPEKGTTFHIVLPISQQTRNPETGRNLLNAFLASRNAE